MQAATEQRTAHWDTLVKNSREVPVTTKHPEKAKQKRKIAIIGTAPQWQLAPFDDPEWEIWGIFGVVGCGKRFNRIYELHDKSVIEPMADQHKSGVYWETVSALGENYITKDPYDKAPNAKRFDFDGKLKKYGKYFASSASWLIAEAIDEGATTIGLWGINMASDSEYAYQKPSCTYLLGYARAKGVEIVIPESSELLSVPFQYGIEKPPLVWHSLEQKMAEINQQLAAHRNNLEVSKMGVYGAEQSLDILKWMKQNWK
jgi:hypothetical protein